jgi:RimJ/RimL family protein N-acetyltransferase
MSEVYIREATEQDFDVIKSWLLEKDILQWFPMESDKEVEDAARIWVYYARLKSCFIAEINSIPVGTILLNITNLEKIQHQCLISIIVSQNYRNQGIGTKLLNYVEKVAFEEFKIELLHLEVYENNPAKRLYEKVGYETYGLHPNFLKENGGYKSKILMQKWLIQRKER